MKISTPNKYQLNISPDRSYRVILDGEDRNGFRSPDTKVCPKIYVVMEGRKFHYVGITNRPMSARINYGLKATGKNGYHGYQWKDNNRNLQLFIWAFPENESEEFRKEIKATEAEFAFQVRTTTGIWPHSQTEIHFYPPSREQKAAAKKMLKQCRTK